MDNWLIVEREFEPDKLHAQETVFTIGNGYLGTRGAFEEGYPGQQAATFVHGVYDDIPILFTELVNAPNWLDFALFFNGERFRLDRRRVLSYRRSLDLRTGTLRREVRWQSSGGETVEIEFERFASLADEHVLCVQCRVKSVDFSGELEIRAGLPGHVDNDGWVHWDWVDQGSAGPHGAYLQVKTRATGIHLCEAYSLNITGEDGSEAAYWDSHMTPTLVARTRLEPGGQVEGIKLVSMFTSRDTAEPRAAALEKLSEAAVQGYEALRAANRAAWEREWEQCNIVIEGDDEADRSLRYSLFQLLIAAPRNDDRVSIGAKSLSGYGYRGHVFWDTEIFILPFFTYTRPEIARNLLMYRFHSLPGARQKAKMNGYEGAMFAWESAATGEETTPRWVPDPNSSELVRIWCGDIEHHISADVAYGVHQYWQVTGDDAFLRDYGAEIILDTARFWGSRTEWNERRDRYEINNVIGPDEYHDHVDNNAYTNILARWNLQTAFKVLDWLQAQYPHKAAGLGTSLDLTPERLDHWKDVIEKLYLGYDPQTGIFEQFEGFFQKKYIPLQDYEPRTKSMQALLGIEGAQEYQYIKQPDVLMMLYLLRDHYDWQTIEANWKMYTPRTDLNYGSSLGPAIQAALAARTGIGEIDTAYLHFIHAAQTDLKDVRGNTADGIHAATAGGLWQAAVLGFGGLKISEHGPAAAPNLPRHWTRLKFRIQYHGQPYQFDLRPEAPGRGQANIIPTRRPRFPILGAIFDLDGVLTDTSEYHYLAWQRLADEEAFPFTRQENEALRGVPRRESLVRLLKGRKLPEAQMQEMMDRKNRYYQEFIERLAPADLLPGAQELLEDLRRSGVKVAIGSASKNAGAVVDRLGIESLVDAISDGYSVERQKPAPDLFLHAAAQLGVPPEQCVVFEDAEAGVEAALAGGMWTVGIGPQGRVGAAHLVLPNLEGLSWEVLRGRLERVEKARGTVDREAR